MRTTYSGVDKDSSKTYELVNEDYDYQRFFRSAVLCFSIALLILSLLLFATAVAVLVNVRVADSDAKDISFDVEGEIEATCAGYDVRGIVVGSDSSNVSALFVDNTLQQLQLVVPSESATVGRAVWVSQNDEIWVPNYASSTIYVYETITWKIRRTLSHSNCDGPDYGAYHPLAGPDDGGQVWFACTANDAWIAYDPNTYERLTTILMAKTLQSTYDPFDVRLGEDVATVSLKNTTGSWSGVIVQYSTQTFLPVASYAGVGAHMRAWYGGKTSSYLFGSSAFTGEIYKFNYNPLILMDTINQTSPQGLTTDPFDEFLYVAREDDLASAIYGYDVSTMTQLVGSPYSSPFNGTRHIITAFSTNRLFATSPAGTSPNTLTVYSYERDTGVLTFDEYLQTTDEASKLARAANGCPCRLCKEWI